MDKLTLEKDFSIEFLVKLIIYCHSGVRHVKFLDAQGLGRGRVIYAKSVPGMASEGSWMVATPWLSPELSCVDWGRPAEFPGQSEDNSKVIQWTGEFPAYNEARTLGGGRRHKQLWRNWWLSHGRAPHRLPRALILSKNLKSHNFATKEKLSSIPWPCL